MLIARLVLATIIHSFIHSFILRFLLTFLLGSLSEVVFNKEPSSGTSPTDTLSEFSLYVHCVWKVHLHPSPPARLATPLGPGVFQAQ